MQNSEVHSETLVCQHCWTGPFSMESVRKVLSGNYIWFETTWSKVQVSAESGCRFCRLLLSEKEDGIVLQDQDNIEQEEKCAYSLAITRNTADPVTGTYNWTPAGIQFLSIRLEGYEIIDHSGYALYTSSEDPAACEIVARNPVHQVGTSHAYQLASEYLKDCLANHNDCPPPNKDTILPTRVIDCSNPGQPRLFISNGTRDVYGALSYVWGEQQPHRTLTSNVDQNVKGIDISLIPQTIRDAIVATHTFGLRYLWVDAFCILQDSKEDKRREIAQMRRIFRDAYFTIVAASAPSASAGFLQDRMPSSAAPDIRLPFRCHDGQIGSMSLFPMWMREEEAGEPVDQRAWCLEERLLSPRKFVYASDTLQYHCQTSMSCIGDALSSPRLATRLPNVLFLPPPEIISAMSQWTTPEWRQMKWAWMDAVRNYTCRTVTHASDKLSALAGVAEQFHVIWNKGRYLAGLWEEHLLHQLLWYNSRDTPLRPRPSQYLAPTWSWASIDAFITLWMHQ